MTTLSTSFVFLRRAPAESHVLRPCPSGSYARRRRAEEDTSRAHAIRRVGIFEQRYLTRLIPLCAALLAGAVDSLRWRAAVLVAALVLVAAGVAIVILRHGRELEPDYGRVQQATRGVRTVLTNSAVAAYYVHDPKPVLDRPVNLGPGLEAGTRRPYAVVDDNSSGGARPGPGRVVARVADRIVVRVVR